MKKKSSKEKTTRKNVVFSVSFQDKELEEVEEYLTAQKKETGVNLSRNQLIRKATLAKVRHAKSPQQSFEEHFKSI